MKVDRGWGSTVEVKWFPDSLKPNFNFFYGMAPRHDGLLEMDLKANHIKSSSFSSGVALNALVLLCWRWREKLSYSSDKTDNRPYSKQWGKLPNKCETYNSGTNKESIANEKITINKRKLQPEIITPGERSQNSLKESIIGEEVLREDHGENEAIPNADWAQASRKTTLRASTIAVMLSQEWVQPLHPPRDLWTNSSLRMNKEVS